jgi:putative endonuclease
MNDDPARTKGSGTPRTSADVSSRVERRRSHPQQADGNRRAAEGSHLSTAGRPQPRERRYFVYMMASKNHRTLYIGVTNDLDGRVRQHRAAEDGEAFTARYHCVLLVYFEAFDCIEWAIAREKQLKGWRREKKDALVARMNPRWEDLSAGIGRSVRIVERNVEEEGESG